MVGWFVGWVVWLVGWLGHGVEMACRSEKKKYAKEKKNTEAVRRLIQCRSVVSLFLLFLSSTRPCSVRLRWWWLGVWFTRRQLAGWQATANVGLRGYGVQNRDCQPSNVAT